MPFVRERASSGTRCSCVQGKPQRSAASAENGGQVVTGSRLVGHWSRTIRWRAGHVVVWLKNRKEE